MRVLGLNQTYRYSDLLEDLEYLTATYGANAPVYRIGTSHDNRGIFMIKLGWGCKPVIITAGVHGRENINPVVLMRLIENYLELALNREPIIADYVFLERLNETRRRNYYTGQNCIPREYPVYEYLCQYTFYIVPMLNPDGYEIATGGFDTIRDPRLREEAKKRGIPSSEWKFNARGVDINRNFPAKSWHKKWPDDYPASENETRSLMCLFNQIPAIGYLDVHSRGEEIYYFRNTQSYKYNCVQKCIARHLSDVTGYQLMMPEDEIEAYDTGGNSVHYFAEYFNRPSITIETVEETAGFPLDVSYQTKVFHDLVLVMLEFARGIECCR